MTAPESQEPQAPEGKDPRRWRALAVTLAAGFMSLLDVSIVNVALPSIQRGLGASPGAVQWVVSGYALTFGLALVAGGRLGDALGRRRMFLIALTGFVATSALAGAAPTASALIAARLLQGLAAGMLTPQNSGLIQDLFRGPERGRAFGMFGATVGISTAVGPVLGGLIINAFGQHNGWRWVFYVNVPIGILALVLAARLLPALPRQAGRRLRAEIDFVGAALLGLAVLCVLFPLVGAQNVGLRWLWLLFPVAVVMALLFVRWERRTVRRGRSPLLDPGLVTSTRGYATGVVVGTVYFCGFAGIWLVFALFFQDGMGYTPLQSGLAVTPFALGSSLAAVVAGRLVARWGRRLTVFGLVLVALGLAAAAWAVHQVPAERTGLAVALPLLVAGLGGGAVISPNTTLTLECVPTRTAGVAGGALQTGQRIGTAVGTAALAAVFHAVVSATHGYQLALSAALACAVGFIAIALVVAVVELRARTAQAVREADEAAERETARCTADTHRT